MHILEVKKSTSKAERFHEENNTTSNNCCFPQYNQKFPMKIQTKFTYVTYLDHQNKDVGRDYPDLLHDCP